MKTKLLPIARKIKYYILKIKQQTEYYKACRHNYISLGFFCSLSEDLAVYRLNNNIGYRKIGFVFFSSQNTKYIYIYKKKKKKKKKIASTYIQMTYRLQSHPDN